MQAWLQAMQARISSLRPLSASWGMVGSQMSARFMMHGVGLAGFEEPFGLLRLVDPSGDEHRDVDELADLGRCRGRYRRSAMFIGGTMWSEPASVAEVPTVTLR